MNPNPNPNLNNNIQSASIDLNNPVGLGQNSQSNFLINCPTGVVVYQPSLTTNEIVPICVTNDMLNSRSLKLMLKLRMIIRMTMMTIMIMIMMVTIITKKHFKHYPVYYNKNFWNHYLSNTHPGKNNNNNVVLTDPRDDPKYDSIDWRSDDGKSDLSLQEMDKILEDQQNKKGDTDNQGNQPIITTFTTTSAPAPASNQNTDTIASNSGDGVGNTDDNGDGVETQESTESTESGTDSGSGSNLDSDGGDSGSSDGGGDSGGSDGVSDGGSDSGGENN